MTEQRPPLPPFTRDSAIQKVRAAEDGWNSRDPARVALAYTPDSVWRNRSEFLTGRADIESFLKQKWQRELDYRLIKELWAHDGNRIAVRFAYEWHDRSGQWYRSYGNENWEFEGNGLMRRRIPATFVNSDLSQEEKRLRGDMVRRSAFKFLYLAPERFFRAAEEERRLLDGLRPAYPTWWWTRRIALTAGDGISGPSTGAWRRFVGGSAIRRSWP